MRNVIVWHWFIKNLVGTWRRYDVDATSLRRIDVVTTSCACWEFAPPIAPPPPPNILNLSPPNILNLPTPITGEVKIMWIWSECSIRTCYKNFLLRVAHTRYPLSIHFDIQAWKMTKNKMKQLTKIRQEILWRPHLVLRHVKKKKKNYKGSKWFIQNSLKNGAHKVHTVCRVNLLVVLASGLSPVQAD